MVVVVGGEGAAAPPLNHSPWEADWLHVYAFAPPPVLSMPLAGRFDKIITSVVVGKDVVPRMQFNSINRLGNRLSCTHNNSSDSALPCLPLANSADPMLVVPELYIAGTILFSTKPSNRKTRLCQVERESVLLHEIFVGYRMVQNHLPDHYVNALTVIAEQRCAQTNPP